MSYALVIDNSIQSIGRLPSSARRLDTGEWVMGLATAPIELREATGWYEVVDAVRPEDTTNTTWDRTIELIEGAPTVVWTERAKSQGELDNEALTMRDNNRTTNLINAIATLRQWSDQAEATTVTSGNAVATLQTIVTRLGVFFDRFADLLENQYGEDE